MEEEKYKYVIRYEKGTVELIKINEWLGEIEHLQVPFHNRRKGIGRLLIQQLEADARKLGLHKLSLLCKTDNKSALNLYIKEDYQIEGLLRNHFENGIDFYVMSKNI